VYKVFSFFNALFLLGVSGERLELGESGESWESSRGESGVPERVPDEAIELSKLKSLGIGPLLRNEGLLCIEGLLCTSSHPSLGYWDNTWLLEPDMLFRLLLRGVASRSKLLWLSVEPELIVRFRLRVALLVADGVPGRGTDWLLVLAANWLMVADSSDAWGWKRTLLLRVLGVIGGEAGEAPERVSSISILIHKVSSSNIKAHKQHE
jgi:hypothetical protein